MTASLPGLNSPRIKELTQLPNYYNAYSMVLNAVHHAVEQRDIISAQIVGYFLLEFHEQSPIFGDAACVQLVKWITSTPQEPDKNENDVIYCLGMFLFDNFIQLFQISDVLNETLQHIDIPPQDIVLNASDQAHAKALERDSFRCMITGMLDRDSVVTNNHQDLLEEAAYQGINKVSVEAAQILHGLNMQGIDLEKINTQNTKENEINDAATGIAIPHTFQFTDFMKAFKIPGDVQQVWNILSLEPNLHRKFNSLQMWLEGTPKMNCYKVCVLDQRDEEYICRNFNCPQPNVDGAPMVVDFSPLFEGALAPPNPHLLALHATCARVSHMSGAAKFVEQIESDMEARNEPSAHLLSCLSSPFAATKVIS